jgi:hypothetical protein
MTRRVVLGNRGGAYGLWVSKPGFNALSAGDANLLFTMTRRNGMVLDSGTVTVPAGGSSLRVAFSDTFPSIPLVFCGSLTTYPNDRACSVLVDASGFYLRAEIVNGSYPAAGTSVRWFAVMKKQG